jgi:hypothetical protein
MAQSPLSDQRERQSSGGGSPHYGLFPADKDHPLRNPQQVVGFFT